MRNVRGAILFVLLALAAASACANDYEVGQIWSYKTRPQDPASALMILRIDSDTPLGEVIFIRVINVNFQAADGKMLVLQLSPLPFTRAALDRSVIKMTGKTSQLNWTDTRYRIWKQAASEGKNVKLYRGSVAAAVSELEPRILSDRKRRAAVTKQSQ